MVIGGGSHKDSAGSSRRPAEWQPLPAQRGCLCTGSARQKRCANHKGEKMRNLLAAVAVAAACAALPAYAATDAECQAEWTKADVNKDGTLTEAESMRYAAALRVHDKTMAEGKLDQASFMKYCQEDVFAVRKAEAGAPLKGANSFTEGQAKDRAMAHGFTSVSNLKKDGDGIWRGSAMQDGKAVQVAVDYKGNVVPVATQ